MKHFDPLLLQGLPYKNGEVDYGRLRFYNMIFAMMRISGAISILLGFVLMASHTHQNNAFLRNFNPYAHYLGLVLFVVFCVMFGLLMLHFLSLKIKDTKQSLKLLTPYHQSIKIKLSRFFQVLSILFFCVLFAALGFMYAGFFIFHIALLAIPKIKAIYADDDLLYAEFCISLGLVSIGLYPIKNDENLYYCEFTFSQSTIPMKVQQIVRCLCQDNYLVKYRTFGFARNIDSKELIKSLNHRAILQDKIPNAQNTKIDRREL